MKRLAAAFSFALLAFQIYIPWSVDHVVTQDGPSHLYTAYMAQDLLFHRHTSPYHAVYTVKKTALPNWTGTILAAAFMGVFGPNRAEAFLMSVCLLAGYFSFAYAAKAFGVRGSPWLVMGNWLLQTVFLWSGFYNFCLGMAVLPLAIGYYVRHTEAFDWKRAGKLALGLVALYFTHLIPTLLAVMTIFVLAVWRWRWNGWRRIGMVTLTFIPALVLVALYASGSRQAAEFKPEIWHALLNFPEVTFSFARGKAGEASLLWPAALFLIVAAVVAMRRREWRSAKGGLAVAMLLAFAIYLVIPDAGFGGSVVKLRFALAVFVLGGLLVSTVDRLRMLRGGIAVYIGALLLCQLAEVYEHVQQTSAMADAYLAATEKIEPGARFVRVYYPVPAAAHKYGLDEMYVFPMLHLDALAAVRRHAVALSDYQSATGTFGVDYKPTIGDGQRSTLWQLESPGDGGKKELDWLRGNLPVKLDYVVLIGEPGSERLAGLENATPVSQNAGRMFVRVYRLE